MPYAKCRIVSGDGTALYRLGSRISLPTSALTSSTSSSRIGVFSAKTAVSVIGSAMLRHRLRDRDRSGIAQPGDLVIRSPEQVMKDLSSMLAKPGRGRQGRARPASSS